LLVVLVLARLAREPEEEARRMERGGGGGGERVSRRARRTRRTRCSIVAGRLTKGDGKGEVEGEGGLPMGGVVGRNGGGMREGREIPGSRWRTRSKKGGT
jgi:hypothetical protein